MIVPGLGSNGIVIGEDIDAVIRRFGKHKFRISKPSHVGELFKNVFKIASDTKYILILYTITTNKNALRACSRARLSPLSDLTSTGVTKDAGQLAGRHQ